MKKPSHSAPPGNFLLLAVLCALSVPTVQAGEEDFARCAKQYPDDNAARLKCYDSAVSSASATVLPQPVADVPVGEKGDGKADDEENGAPADATQPSDERSYLTRAWNLDDRNARGESKVGRLRPHRQSYLLVRKSGNANSQPTSPAIGHSALTPRDIDALEAKFQLSFKADIGSQQDIDLLGMKTLRLWGAYTQQSSWQVFNMRNSSPFRETDYEPELIATFGTGAAEGLKLVNLAWVHQSNGRPLPESRSWNRLYLQGGWEWNNSTSILARGWYRIPEKLAKDDNPDIVDYVGRADLVARWEPADKRQAVSILLRNNLNMAANRGFVQIDWSMPFALGNAARVHAQFTSGFGESLIDYNHSQNTFGLGFSFREW
ncbi:MAG: phospholipase A [Nitrosomonadales bacterium]|nr:phospholipase A [Nitrosomonadales bacterium]